MKYAEEHTRELEYYEVVTATGVQKPQEPNYRTVTKRIVHDPEGLGIDRNLCSIDVPFNGNGTGWSVILNINQPNVEFFSTHGSGTETTKYLLGWEGNTFIAVVYYK